VKTILEVYTVAIQVGDRRDSTSGIKITSEKNRGKNHLVMRRERGRQNPIIGRAGSPEKTSREGGDPCPPSGGANIQAHQRLAFPSQYAFLHADREAGFRGKEREADCEDYQKKRVSL